MQRLHDIPQEVSALEVHIKKIRDLLPRLGLIRQIYYGAEYEVYVSLTIGVSSGGCWATLIDDYDGEEFLGAYEGTLTTPLQAVQKLLVKATDYLEQNGG